MILFQAIQKIISDYGADILKERRFVGLLSDYQAFEDLPFAKTILKQMYSSGYEIQLYEAYAAKDKTQIAALISSIANKLAYDPKKVAQMFSEFDQAFGIKKQKAKRTWQKKSKNTSNKPKQTPPPYYNNNKTYTYQQPNNEPTWMTNRRNESAEDFHNRMGRMMSGQATPSDYTDYYPQDDSDDSDYYEPEDLSVLAKIIFAGIALLLNFIAYCINPWWLILTILNTIFWISPTVLGDNPDKTLRIKTFACFVAIMITIITPLPWWSIPIAIFIAFIFISMHKRDD